MLTNLWHTWLALAPWLLVGAVVAGLLHALLPPGFLNRRLTGRRGVLNAVLLGVPLPLCSCGVIPTGLGLKKQGAGDGATVGFLISTPQTGVDSVLVTSAFLGLPFAVFKVVWAALTGFAGGLLAERQAKPALPIVQQDAAPASTAGRWRGAFDHALELLRSIWLWIVIGVIISAGITTWLPQGGLESLTGYGGLPAMGLALVISLPLYVCATASVPIAASLVAAGLPTGAAMVFLMAGPATNVATIGAVYRTLGGRQLGVYLSTIIAGSIAGGLLFDGLIEAPSQALHTHTHESPWWAVASGVVLIAMFVWFAIDDLRRRFRQAKPDEPATVSVGVGGMTCGGCVAKLEKALTADPAITSARVTLTPGRADVTGGASLARVREIVRRAGFTAS